MHQSFCIRNVQHIMLTLIYLFRNIIIILILNILNVIPLIIPFNQAIAMMFIISEHAFSGWVPISAMIALVRWIVSSTSGGLSVLASSWTSTELTMCFKSLTNIFTSLMSLDLARFPPQICFNATLIVCPSSMEKDDTTSNFSNRDAPSIVPKWM